MEHSQELTTYWSTKLTSTNLSIQKLFEVYSPNHNGKKLEIKLRKQNEKKKLTTQRLNMLSQWVNEKIKREI